MGVRVPPTAPGHSHFKFIFAVKFPASGDFRGVFSGVWYVCASVQLNQRLLLQMLGSVVLVKLQSVA